jgi:hypothetical protein
MKHDGAKGLLHRCEDQQLLGRLQKGTQACMIPTETPAQFYSGFAALEVAAVPMQGVS